MVSVVEAAERDLAELEERKPGISSTALAASLMALAHGLDDPRPSLAMKALAQEKFARTWNDLQALAPVKREVTPLDEIRERREARLAAAEDPVGSRRRTSR